jgi:2-phospho-L-lactate guanylyltransferase
LVPVKRLSQAKSRLRGALPDVAHERLVLALAAATVRAALAADGVGEVVVVTNDMAVRATLAGSGARFAADPEESPDGLNAALRYAEAMAARDGMAARAVAALTGDIPALRPGELAEALARAAHGRSFVPDLPGTGTVLLAAPPGSPLDPRFGPASAEAHARSGAARLDGSWPTLRRDVDTAADLREAVALGWRSPVAETRAAA